jgi:dCTP deaminase
MILSQVNLRAAVAAGDIGFDPALEENQWGEASVDLRLGFSFTRLTGLEGLIVSVANGLGSLGKSGVWATKELKRKDELGDPERFILEPGRFILAMTHESIKVPTNMIALVEGRSTYARVGLSMHQTAPWIQPGWSGPIILEIMNHGPLRIELTPLIDRPCQLTFFELKTELPPEIAYGSRPTDRYQDQRHPLKHGES